MVDWMHEIDMVTRDFEITQRTPTLSELMHGSKRGFVWPERWLPYFGDHPAKMVAADPVWQEHPVVEPYTLTFVRSNRIYFTRPIGSEWLASFDPGGRIEVREPRGVHQLSRVTKLSVDFRCPARYAEDKHKDDVAVPTKKWKFL
jgi:hypothetical protein